MFFWFQTVVSMVNLPNVVWVVLFGWWIAAFYAIVTAILLATFVGWPFASVSWAFAKYFFWPFGKYLCLMVCISVSHYCVAHAVEIITLLHIFIHRIE